MSGAKENGRERTWVRGGRARRGGVGGGGDLWPSERSRSAGARQSIEIHLTGTEGEWDCLTDSQLIFSMDQDYPSISLSRDSPFSQEEEEEEGGGGEGDSSSLRSPALHVPLSPSSPGSPVDCCGSAPTPGLLTPGPPHHHPPGSLVKSLSAEEGSSPRPRPPLSLVKSVSTEISCSEPEVAPSRSDSRLNLHLWNKLTQQGPKGRVPWDFPPRTTHPSPVSLAPYPRTAPPSPGGLSPSEGPRGGGFFRAELEDTRRKLSEAMQEPLSMFTKILKDDSSPGSPKRQGSQQGPQSAGSPGSRGLSGAAGRDGGRVEAGLSEPLPSPAFNWPCVRHPGMSRRGTPCSAHQSLLLPPEHGSAHQPRPPPPEDLEICTDDDILQVVAAVDRLSGLPDFLVSSGPRLLHRPRPPPPPPPPPAALPRVGLFCVALLSYAYFTVPLSPYLSGLALGTGLGFLLGLLLIRLGSSGTPSPGPALPHRGLPSLGPSTEADLLTAETPVQGWMMEVGEYDPEAAHPGVSQAVWASLEGGCLSLAYPRTNLPRRAEYDERLPESSFTRTLSYQLANCTVSLLPPVLARKRLWNPKYPICLLLGGREGQGSTEEQGATVESPRAEQGLGPQTQPDHATKPALQPSTTLYLFGRTGREKEEWFHHFLSASMVTEKGVPVVGSTSPSGGTSSSPEGETPPAPSTLSTPQTQTFSSTLPLDYPSYMARLLAAKQPSPLASPGGSSSETSPTSSAWQRCTCDPPEFQEEGQTAWVNALIGRIFWDFLQEQYWADLVSHKIQRKLSRIRLPYFMNELTLTELDMGSCLPQVTRASRPVLNHRGLWLQLDVEYTGALQMSLQTRFHLSRLGREGRGEGPEGQDTQSPAHTASQGSRPVLSVLADSDQESSSAASSDDEELLLSEPQGIVGEKGTLPVTDGVAVGGGRTGRRLLRFVDKIANSRYFQKAKENEFIRKKMEEMSNTPLLLTVEVKELSGPLVVNIPPPPTDRIWYSFCEPPRLDLRVRPKLGEREVTFCHVTDWIGRKLQNEFQKVFVLPNMDDIYLPMMHSGMDSPYGCQSGESPPPMERTSPDNPTDCD